MSVFKNRDYKSKKENFSREFKRITRRELTTDTDLIADYKKSIVKTYNKLTAYFAECHDKVNDFEERQLIIDKHKTFFTKLETCLNILSVTVHVENQILPLVKIDELDDSIVEETLYEEENEEEVEEEELGDEEEEFVDFESEESEQESIAIAQREIQSNSVLTTVNNIDTNNSSDLIRKNPGTSNNIRVDNSLDSVSSELNNGTKMVQSAKDFMTIANSTIGSRFDGDPMKLDSFIDSCSLLDTLCEAGNKEILLRFVLTRLEGKAREIIPENPANVTAITDSLKANIKYEPSKVVEGKILALRAERNNLSKFAEKAEELAEQFRRSLCSEGFTKQKAKEFAIEKTVEMCRKSARSDTIKAILSASKFEEPKEVIAKMIIEISNTKQERMEAQTQRQFQNNRGGRGNSSNNSNRGNGHRNDNSAHRGNRSNNTSFRNNSNNNSGNYSGNNSNSNNYNRSNNFGNGHNNNHRGNNHRNSNRSNSSNVHTIRIVSGNESASQAERHDIPL